MGMFDSVVARCPNCGTEVEFQSKVGHCTLTRYTPATTPLQISADIDGQTQDCACGYTLTARLVTRPHLVFE